MKKPNSLYMGGSQKGAVLAEVLAGAGVAIFTLLVSSQVFLSARKIESDQEASFWISARRNEIINQLRSPAGWNEILVLNPSLECLTAQTGCPQFAGAPNPFRLQLGQDNNGNPIILDGSQTTTGLTRQGDFCSTFGADQDLARCEIGIQLQWEALCDSASCLRPQAKVSVKFQKKDSSGFISELETYRLDYFYDPKLDSISKVCNSMSGTFDGTICKLPQLSSSCSPSNGLYPLGFDDQGSVVCGKIIPSSCGNNEVLTGFDSGGKPVCSAACS